MYWGNVGSSVLATAGILTIPNLEWWQSLVVILGIAGLSPAPWLLGMAAGKIQFSAVAAAAHERELAQQQKRHEREMAAQREYHGALMDGEKARYATLQESNEANRLAAERQQARADQLTDAVFEVVEVVRASSHVISAVNEVTQEVVRRDAV